MDIFWDYEWNKQLCIYIYNVVYASLQVMFNDSNCCLMWRNETVRHAMICLHWNKPPDWLCGEARWLKGYVYPLLKWQLHTNSLDMCQLSSQTLSYCCLVMVECYNACFLTGQCVKRTVYNFCCQWFLSQNKRRKNCGIVEVVVFDV